MLSTILRILFDIFKEDKFIIAILLYLAVLFTIAGALYKSKRYLANWKALRWKLSTVLVIALHILSIVLYFDGMIAEKYGWLLLGINAIIDVLVVLYLKYVPSYAMRKMKRLAKEQRQDLLRFYHGLMEIKTQKLSPSDYKFWKRQYCYLLFVLGSVNKAAELMKEVNEKDSAWYKMYQSMQAEAKGNLEKSQKKIQQAYLALKENEDVQTKIQILNNYGRMCRIYGNHLEAVQFYGKAADLITPKTDTDIIHTIYSNLIMESCILRKEEYEIRRLMDEYRRFLHNDNVEEMIELENLKLEMAREFGDQKKTRSLVEESYDRMMKMLESDVQWEKRLCYEITSLRVAHMAVLNLDKYLSSINKDMDKILEMDMPQRYYLIKEIHNCLQMPPFLAPGLIEKYKELFAFANRYMAEQAKQDLEQHLDSLPDVAIYAYGNTQMEIAGLERLRSPYDFTAFYKRVVSVRTTYEQNDLKLEAMMRSLCIADELFSEQNVDRNYDTVHEEELKESIEYADRIAGTLQYHPAYAEYFLQLAYGYIRLCQYEKSLKYYQRFLKCDVAPEHYTHWMQMNIEFVRLMAQVEEYRQILAKLKHDHKAKIHLSPKAVDWLENYPNCSDEDITLLFGGLLNARPILAKRMSWLEETDGGIAIPKQHFWLCYSPENGMGFPQTVIELDLCINRVATEEDAKRIHYFPDRHPLQTGGSAWCREHVKQDGEHSVVLNFLSRDFPEKFEDGTITYLEEIRRIVRKKLIR